MYVGLLPQCAVYISTQHTVYLYTTLSVISKLLERLVSKQLLRYLKDNDLLPDLQSAYREGIIRRRRPALDTGNIAMLTLLDLSVAFDSVDHNTLLQRLRKSYGLGGKVITSHHIIEVIVPNHTD